MAVSQALVSCAITGRLSQSKEDFLKLQKFPHLGIAVFHMELGRTGLVGALVALRSP